MERGERTGRKRWFRRAVLRWGAVAGVGGLSGCSLFDGPSSDEPSVTPAPLNAETEPTGTVDTWTPTDRSDSPSDAETTEREPTVTHESTDTTGTWPVVQADEAHTGWRPDADGPDSPVEVAWSVDVGGDVQGSVTLTDGHVFVGSADGLVTALDASDGTVRWTFEADGEVRATPTVADGLVYCGDESGALTALDAERGTE